MACAFSELEAELEDGTFDELDSILGDDDEGESEEDSDFDSEESEDDKAQSHHQAAPGKGKDSKPAADSSSSKQAVSGSKLFTLKPGEVGPLEEEKDEETPLSFSRVEYGQSDAELAKRFPLFPGRAAALEVYVEAGQMLYLPAGESSCCAC